MTTSKSEYDAGRFDALVREQLHAAATAGLSPTVVAAILRSHAAAVEQRGLDAHAGVTAGSPAGVPIESERDHDRDHARTRHQAD